MTGMNRLSPWIVRREEDYLPPRRRTSGAVALRHWNQYEPFAGTEPARSLEQLKLFATGWIGGLIFFGTYLS